MNKKITPVQQSGEKSLHLGRLQAEQRRNGSCDRTGL